MIIYFKKFFIVNFLLLNIFFFFSCSLFYGPSVKKLFNNESFNWKVEKLKNFNFYYEPDTYVQQHLEELKIKHEKFFYHILSILDEKKYEDTIHVFIVDSKDKMKMLTGNTSNAKAYAKQNVFCFIYSEKLKSVGAHELMHIISINLWGVSDLWIMEGLAVYSDDSWHGYDLHKLCNYLRLKGELIPLKDLITNFKSYDDMITYPEAGSIIKFISEKYGIEIVKRIWMEKDISEISGKSIEIIQQEWYSKLDEYECTNIKYKI